MPREEAGAGICVGTEMEGGAEACEGTGTGMVVTPVLL